VFSRPTLMAFSSPFPRGRVFALDVRGPGSKRPRYRLRLSDLEAALAVTADHRHGGRGRRGVTNVVEYF